MCHNAIHWQISTSIKVIMRTFSLDNSFPEILMLQIFNFENLGQCQGQMNDFLFDTNSNVCSISHHLQDIRKLNKMKNI